MDESQSLGPEDVDYSETNDSEQENPESSDYKGSRYIIPLDYEPFEIDDEDEQTDPSGSENSESKDHFRRLGFYRIVTRKGNKEALLLKYKEEQDKEWNSIESMYKDVLAKYNKNISALVAKKKVEEDNLKDYLDSVDELLAVKENLRNEISKLKEKLRGLYQLLSDKKREFVSGITESRLKKIKDEIQLLIDNTYTLGQNLRDKSVDYVKENRVQIDNYIEHLKEQIRTSQSILETINKKLIRLGEGYLSSGTLSMLGVLSVIAIGASGWFFSIFAEQAALGSTDEKSFLLDIIFNFGNVLYSESNIEGNFELFVKSIVVGIVLLALPTLIYIIVHYVLIALNPNSTQEIIEFDITKDKNGNKLHTIRKSKLVLNTPLYTWIKKLPVFFLTTLILLTIIFLASSDGAPEVDRLNTALSAQIIGVSIALASGGIFYLYINFVIENRLAKEQEFRILQYWELVLVLGLFFAMLIAVPIFFSYTSDDALSNKNSSLLSLFLFFIMVVVSGVLMGYYIKFSSIINRQKGETKKLDDLQLKVFELSSSRPTHNFVLNDDFVEKYKNINNEIFEHIRHLNRESELIVRNGVKINEGNSGSAPRTERHFVIFRNFFFSFPKPSNINSHQGATVAGGPMGHLSDSDLLHDAVVKKYFPTEYYAINDTLEDIRSKTEKLDALTQEIEGIRVQKNDRITSTLEQIADLEKRIEELERLKLRLYKKKQTRRDRWLKKYEEIEVALLDGFELGELYLLSGIKSQTIEFEDESNTTDHEEVDKVD